jgi:hypothetical protein
MPKGPEAANLPKAIVPGCVEGSTDFGKRTTLLGIPVRG